MTTPIDPHIIYGRHSDNLARTATISLDGCTAELGYEVGWVADHSAGRPLRLVETSGTIAFDLGAPYALEVAALFHCNFEAGLTVTLEGGGGAISHTFTIPAWRADRFPMNPWVDLTQLSGFGAYQNWTLTIGSNSVPLSIGDVWLGGALRRLNPDFAQGRRPAYERPQVEHATAYKRLRAPLGTTRRSIAGHIPPSDDTLIEDVRDWIGDADGRAFLFIPDATVNDAWLAIHTTTRQEFEDWLDHDATSLDLSIEEDGRGLEPSPSPLD